MRDRDLYAQILGMHPPWKVTEVDLDTGGETVEVHVLGDAGPLCCPECGKAGPRHDHRERRWRHLDTCQFRTILVADVPRVRCAEHGVRQIEVPWAEPGSSFTALFESLVIDWLLEASLSAVARRLRLTWDQVDGVMERAVRRGPAEKAWKKWLAWALRCRLDPMRKVAKSIRSHLWGILNAIYFHQGGLDLHPRPRAAHTIS